MELSANPPNTADYVGKYRDFKYQEVLFEQFSRQFEMARLDEAREGLLQVVDRAQVPERKSWPKRAVMGAVGGAVGLAALLAYVLATASLRGPGRAALRQRLRAAFARP